MNYVHRICCEYPNFDLSKTSRIESGGIVENGRVRSVEWRGLTVQWKVLLTLPCAEQNGMLELRPGASGVSVAGQGGIFIGEPLDIYPHLPVLALPFIIAHVCLMSMDIFWVNPAPRLLAP